MSQNSRGSIWRKWDLHLHAPGTTLSDDYGRQPSDLRRFCRALEESDVQAFGVADYFSFASFFRVSALMKEEYPDSTKLFLPNLELRLNEAVNGNDQIVHLHLLFKPDLSEQQAGQILRELKTESTDEHGRKLRCSDLRTKDNFEGSVVTRSSITAMFREVYGTVANRAQNVMVVVPSNNDGIRAPGSHRRKQGLADEIDKFADAIFGGQVNSAWFLREDRYAGEGQKSQPKPVFSGSDAHSFKQLEDWLGKDVQKESTRKEVTWIKAEPTFLGLQQTLIEPKERVRIQPAEPDAKEPYKVIRAITFNEDTDEFPPRIELNPNLVSIIGSRSSGKSSLLSYLSHSVDPDYTIRQQVAAGVAERESTAGPAAGKTWKDVDHIECKAEWVDGTTSAGKVIYIPQNSLYKVSERPEEITRRIEPVIFRRHPELRAEHGRTQASLASLNGELRAKIEEWFNLDMEMDKHRASLTDLGDALAVRATRDALSTQIEVLRNRSALTAQEVSEYEALSAVFSRIESERSAIREVFDSLGSFVERRDGVLVASDGVGVELRTSPIPTQLPPAIAETLEARNAEVRLAHLASVKELIVSYYAGAEEGLAALDVQLEELESENASLIEKNRANSEIESLVLKHRRQEDSLTKISAQQANIEQLEAQQGQIVELVLGTIRKRNELLAAFSAAFSRYKSDLDDMTFGVEYEVPSAAIEEVSAKFNRQENTRYFDRSSDLINLGELLEEPGEFLESLRSGQQKIRRGQSLSGVAADALSLTPEIRFFASLDGDRIGGFLKSSMTPGKQALFALTLLLNESVEEWPLLIDQPEDDLDSRSIYDVIVPYLLRRKRTRQILMVTHNANLVVGADSEQIVIANRHGSDRTNRSARTFDFKSGPLEASEPIRETGFILESCGVREHACGILDGGEEAFQKRRDKYNLL